MNLSIAKTGSQRDAMGISLVVVLGSLVLLSSLVVAFLLQMGTELKSSKLYADGASARILANSAGNIAITQIADATKGEKNGKTLAWASQPGLIRTYDENGEPFEYFKLYSDDTMVGSKPFNAATASSATASWFKNKALYCDLNEPVSVGDLLSYPIIDGNHLSSVAGVPAGATSYDADNNNQPDIDGFHVKGAPVAPDTDSDPDTNANPVPMPVKWLYVLADGEVISPTEPSGNSVTVPGATSQNPIVGRIAFWTDDESSKVNINVAAEGLYWDTPRAKGVVEDMFKINQPVNGEYQRYPGHPAMTSLSTVIKRPSGWKSKAAIPTVTITGLPSSVALCTDEQWQDIEWANRLYDIVPRIGFGGSQAGSIRTAWMDTTPTPITPDSDRLFASVDELVFRPDVGTDKNRKINNPSADTTSVLSKEFLERARFFLTASSRSPDVNLFNQPRVSNWPITLDKVDAGVEHKTPFDELIAFCTTMRSDLGVNAYRYYFRRQDPNHPNTDLPNINGTTNLNRNRTLLEYLRKFTESKIPGFGGKFSEKYGADNNQILTEIFDYIRGAINLNDAFQTNVSNRYTVGIPSSPFFGTNARGQVVPIEDTMTDTRGFGRYKTIMGASILFVGMVDGDDPVVPRGPMHPKNGFPYVAPFPASTSQVDVLTGLPLPTYSYTKNGSGDITSTTVTSQPVPSGKMRVQAMFVPQFFDPAVGSPWSGSNFQYTVDLSALTWEGVNMAFPVATTVYTINQKPVDEAAFGGQFGWNQVSKPRSATFDLPKGAFLFGGGEVVIKVYAAKPVLAPPASNTLVQTIRMRFDPIGSCPTPLLAPNQIWNNTSSGQMHSPRVFNYRSLTTCTGTYNSANPGTPVASFGGRASTATSQNIAGWIVPEDVVRSLRVKSGDTRLLAARKNVGVEAFEPNHKYQTSERVLGTHNFFNAFEQPYYGAALGRLVAGAPYHGYPADGISVANKLTTSGDPSTLKQNVFGIAMARFSEASDIPLDGVAVGKFTSIQSGDVPGDWDNGPFDVRDGPYIGKVDEGDVGTKDDEPYSWKIKAEASGVMSKALFTPNRQVPSPVVFGSLPTGVKANRPWQTLLFRPEPSHPGAKNRNAVGAVSPGMPADHLLLDLFHMPVVEPYAISEPLSTAGRINMNYQIVPFTYVNRDTGIRALLKSEKLIGIRDDEADVYKQNDYTTPRQLPIRHNIDASETLEGFTKRFDDENEIFRSASEICEIPIIPTGFESSTVNNFWKDRQITGDNSKERIYATLYPRLTTKSNTYTVHIRAQSLKQVKRTSADKWMEGVDQVTGEYRGSLTVERFVDPNHTGTVGDTNDPAFPDYASELAPPPISRFYKFRVVSAKQFAP